MNNVLPNLPLPLSVNPTLDEEDGPTKSPEPSVPLPRISRWIGQWLATARQLKMTTENRERFDAEAAAWDQNPDVHRASDEALQAILGVYPRLKDQRQDGTAATQGFEVLEVGCGTGLLSLRVAPYVKHIVAVDTSQGMVDALAMKLNVAAEAATPTDAAAPRNVTPLCLELTDGTNHASLPRDHFDLVLSHLVLHHVPDLPALLRAMVVFLKPGGWLALTDFQDNGPHARRFHPEAKMRGVERHGIDAQHFAALMEEAGLENVVVGVAWTMDKDVERTPGEWGADESTFKKPSEAECERQSFPFLLCRGRKSAR